MFSHTARNMPRSDNLTPRITAPTNAFDLRAMKAWLECHVTMYQSGKGKDEKNGLVSWAQGLGEYQLCVGRTAVSAPKFCPVHSCFSQVEMGRDL